MSKLATEDTVEKVACPHDELFFGSGGYYVFCKKCSIAWVAIKGPSCDFEIDMSAGTRARPEMCMGTFKWQSSDPRAAINAMSDVREAAIMLRRSGDYAVVLLLLDGGREVELIRERADDSFSHIIEPLGIARAIKEAN